MHNKQSARKIVPETNKIMTYVSEFLFKIIFVFFDKFQ